MLLDKMRGGLYGLAVGDALGVPVEFMPREELDKQPVTEMQGYGTHNQPAGTWSDDTSMTLATMDSLCHGFDPEDLMRRFSDWLNGAYCPYGEVFDIGNATWEAIHRFRQGVPAEQCGGKGEQSNGNGSLMRILPLAFYLYPMAGAEVARSAHAMEMIHLASAVTHAHPRSLMACGLYVCIACRLLAGRSIADAILEGVTSAAAYYLNAPFAHELQNYLDLADPFSLRQRPRQEIASTGYVVDTLRAALYCLMRSSDYAECVRMAVNLGQDTDTVAAVAGGLAGICYGEKGIPARWRLRIPKRGEMEGLCSRLYEECARRA